MAPNREFGEVRRQKDQYAFTALALRTMSNVGGASGIGHNTHFGNQLDSNNGLTQP